MRVKTAVVSLFILLLIFKGYCEKPNHKKVMDVDSRSRVEKVYHHDQNQNKDNVTQVQNKVIKTNTLDGTIKQIAELDMQIKEYEDLFVNAKALSFLEGFIRADIEKEKIKEKMLATEMYELEERLGVESIKGSTVEQNVNVRLLKTKLRFLKMKSDHVDLAKEYLESRLEQIRSLKNDYESKISGIDITDLKSEKGKLENQKEKYMKTKIR